jgi:hypothetical protein
MKKTWLGLLLAVGGICILVGCAKEESFSTGDDSKWNDPNFKIIHVSAYNYTDYEIGRTYLLPPKVNDIANAAMIGGAEMTKPDAARWVLSGGNSPDLAWDLRWHPPVKLKIWWLRIVDEKLYDQYAPYPKNGNMFDPFDPYTNKQTRPGSAWCEYEIEVVEKFGEKYGKVPHLNMMRDELVLYFHLDGTVTGHLEFDIEADATYPYRLDIAQRNQRPKLKQGACLKEIPNPLYGKRKPIIMN